MGIAQSFGVAFDMLRLHKMRAFLTMLGVIIGVMAVTLIVMISNGFQAYMNNQFTGLGAKSIYIFYDPGRRNRDSVGKFDGLHAEDMDFLRDHASRLGAIGSVAQAQAAKVTNGDREVSSPRVSGQDEAYARLDGLELSEGRLFDKADLDEKANVCVIGEEIRDTLFQKENPIGRYIQLPGITLEVIGVIKKKDSFGQSNTKDIRLPLTTLQSKWTGDRKLQLIATEPKPGVSVDDAMNDTWQAMMTRSGNKQVYRIDSNESIQKVFTGVLGAAGMLLAGIAALSLLVGGIGIMNIMLVSVTERTKEIGLRKALGARKQSIMTQFLVEAGVLSLVGGLIGMGIAWSLGALIQLITASKDWPAPGGLVSPFPPTAALGAALVSFAIGVIFGFFPAMSAAKLDPIVALRRE